MSTVSLTEPWRPAHEQSYAYLLGMYLGDGWIVAHRSGRASLHFTLDARYPGVVEQCWTAVVLTLPTCRPRPTPHPNSRAIVVRTGSHPWLLAFPQHGPGRKHLRPIVLEPWQREIVDRHPGEFVRGLIHSDGCRTTNRFKTTLPSGRVAEYEYGRYFFSNLSADIRALFCAACEALGVRWTLSNPRNVSVAHRHSVAKLDELGCAKD